MKANKAFAIFLAAALLTMNGCGGGGGGGGTAPAAITTVSGVASKGPVVGGDVKIYALKADGSKTLLNTNAVVTGPTGEYSASIGTYSGPIYVEVTGGHYTDEATGQTGLTIDPATPLRAALPAASGTVTLSATPLTDLAVQRAGTGANLLTNIGAANSFVSQVFKVDITATKPAAPTQAAFSDPTVGQAQKDYALALAAVSQLAIQPGGSTTIASLVGAGTTITAATASQITSALSSYLAPGNTNNTTGVSGIAGTNLVNLGGGTATVKISTLGTLPTGVLVGGVQVLLTLPAGVTVRADSLSGEVMTGAFAPSGQAASGAFGVARYSASSSTPAQVSIPLASATGFALGEFATIYCDFPPGVALPVAGQFGIVSYQILTPTGGQLGRFSTTPPIPATGLSISLSVS